jgi:hypothetical protein
MNSRESLLKIALEGLRSPKRVPGLPAMPAVASLEDRSALFLQLQRLQDALPRTGAMVARPIRQNRPARL